VKVTLFASLALTGRGHATDRAVILGLAGFEPRNLDPDAGDAVIAAARTTSRSTKPPTSCGKAASVCRSIPTR